MTFVCSGQEFMRGHHTLLFNQTEMKDVLINGSTGFVSVRLTLCASKYGAQCFLRSGGGTDWFDE